MVTAVGRRALGAAVALLLWGVPGRLAAWQQGERPDLEPFRDSAHHWRDINEEEKVIAPEPGQKSFRADDVTGIADNILLYQKNNGGWPKNYDMQAVLTDAQRKRLAASVNDTMAATIDNGATHSHVEFLARAYARTGDARYKDACVRGLRYLLAAQYPNGGWPQFYPDRSGYRKHITFNDGAMIGVLRVLFRIVQKEPQYSFVDGGLRERVEAAYRRGLDAVLRCQIRVEGTPTVWCQQHDHEDFRPQSARTFEPAAFCSMESAEIVRFLMDIPNPSPEVQASIRGAVAWFRAHKIEGIRVDDVKAPVESWEYHSADFDRVVVKDPAAPPIWTRLYELGTQQPVFCNRDGKPVYTLAEVSRERRTGYGWYNYDPQPILDRFPEWERRIRRHNEQ